jgi:hypothetical protein
VTKIGTVQRVMIDKISGKKLILRYVNAIPAAVVSVG